MRAPGKWASRRRNDDGYLQNGDAVLVATTLLGAVSVAGEAALGVSAIALAGNDCTLKTLRGTYVFAASGYNIVAGVAQPKAIVEIIDFNGDGTLSVPAATRSLNGVIARSTPGGPGVIPSRRTARAQSRLVRQAQALTYSSRPKGTTRPRATSFG
jgi:hypothetical protein